MSNDKKNDFKKKYYKKEPKKKIKKEPKEPKNQFKKKNDKNNSKNDKNNSKNDKNNDSEYDTYTEPCLEPEFNNKCLEPEFNNKLTNKQPTSNKRTTQRLKGKLFRRSPSGYRCSEDGVQTGTNANVKHLYCTHCKKRPCNSPYSEFDCVIPKGKKSLKKTKDARPKRKMSKSRIFLNYKHDLACNEYS